MPQSKILIVEDEGIVAMELQERLRVMGYIVTGVATTGEMAFEKATHLRPDLILMDIKLKGNMDGVMATEQIRAQFDIPVIFLTAYADEYTLQRAKMTVPYGYVLKPFEERELYIAIEMALYKHSIETKTKKEGNWLAHTLNAIGDGVIATNAQGQINFINPVAAELTGWSQTEALGQDARQIFQLVDEATHAPVENPISKALRNGLLENSGNATLLIDRAGTARPIDNCAAPIHDKSGQIIEVVLIFRDSNEHIDPPSLFM
ncbi:MAG: response regulator [Chloroflexi bacterium]|nr:response regulator [Chloroflexota bacterium]